MLNITDKLKSQDLVECDASESLSWLMDAGLEELDQDVVFETGCFWLLVYGATFEDSKS